MALAAVLVVGCGANGDERLEEPLEVAGETCERCPERAHFPEMAVPADNALSDARIDLGRHLFYDKRLSGNGAQACAGCHRQELAFSDGRVLPEGSTGHVIPRNAPSLANVGYLPVYTWVNPLLYTLEKQAMVPLFADLVVELGVSGREREVLERLSADATYPDLFARAYPEGPPAALSWDNILRALASFQRSLVSNRAPYDRYLQGEEDAISDAAKRGLALFESDRLSCSRCHEGFNFTRAVRTREQERWKDSFVNTGLYNTSDPGGYPRDNPGLNEISDDPADIGRFRVPSLRNVAVTAPYMHDGSLPTLSAVLDHYARGGMLTASGPRAGDG
ncbi:MAG TPA: di-heme enzyme, partial [Polyangiales bacterium]|nr:di-heme enzyme [Polyangiales bacterium]